MFVYYGGEETFYLPIQLFIFFSCIGCFFFIAIIHLLCSESFLDCKNDVLKVGLEDIVVYKYQDREINARCRQKTLDKVRKEFPRVKPRKKKKFNPIWEITTTKKETLQNKLAENGPYARNHSTGILQPDFCIRLRIFIIRSTYMEFMPIKDKLMYERLSHLKHDRMLRYKECIKDGARQYMEALAEITGIACDFLKIDKDKYEVALKQAEKVPAVALKLKSFMESVRVECEPAVRTEFSLKEVKDALLEKMSLEFACERRLSVLRTSPRSQEHTNLISMFEKTLMSD